MARSQGYATIFDPDSARPAEMDTITCAHCQRIVILHDPDGTRRADAGGFCRLCFKAVCGPCADRGVCDPFEKKLERVEARGRLLAAMGIAMVLLVAGACAEAPATSTAYSALAGGGCFDPAAYGAQPYNAATPVDARPATMNAIDDAIAAGGGRVCVHDKLYVTRAPPGSYNHFAALSWHGTGVELVGDGPQTGFVALGDAGASTFFMIALDPGATDSTIRDLTIDGTGLYNTDQGEQTHGIVIGTNVCAGATCSQPIVHTTVQRVVFHWDGAPGERWGDCVRVSGNSAATQAYDTKLLDLSFLECGRSGVEIQRNANALTISRGFFAADLIGGTPIDGEATGGDWDDGLIVADNQIWKLLAGGDGQMISMTSQRNFAVHHNILRGTLLGGRGCITGVRLQDGTIDHNVCTAQEAVATTGLIDVANLGDNVTIDGNVLRRSGGAGYCVKVVPHSGVGAVGLRVRGNGCVNNTDSAAIMLQGTQRTSVSGNDLVGSGGPNSMGVYVSPGGAVVANLGVTDNRFAGMTYAPVRLVATGGYGFRTTVVALNTSEASGPGLRCDNPTLNPVGGIVAGLNNWSTASTCTAP